MKENTKDYIYFPPNGEHAGMRIHKLTHQKEFWGCGIWVKADSLEEFLTMDVLPIDASDDSCFLCEHLDTKEKVVDEERNYFQYKCLLKERKLNMWHIHTGTRPLWCPLEQGVRLR